MGGCSAWAGVLGCIRKQVEQAVGSKQVMFRHVLYFSPYTEFLPCLASVMEYDLRVLC